MAWDAERILEQLRKISGYFERCMTGNDPHSNLFAPEFEASQRVIKILESRVADDSVRELIIEVVMDIETIKHYDGSGWFDFLGTLNYWLSVKGFEPIDWEEELKAI